MLSLIAAAALLCNTLDADAPRAWRLGHNAFQIFHADFDGDGWRDVAGTHLGTFTIRYGTGGGQFSEPVSMPLEVVGVADVTGDPLPDLIVYDEGVRENRGGRDFSTVIRATAIGGLAVAGDFTGDGRSDVLVASLQHHVLLTFSGGTAQVVTQLDLGMFRRDVRAADFDGDGDLDFIARHIHDHSYRIYSGDGRGNFTPGPPTWSDGDFESADLDRDGRLDRVVTMYGETGFRGVEIRYGNGSVAKLALPAGTDAVSFRLHDFDGDGDLDLALQPYPRLSTYLYFNDRGSLIPAPQTLAGGVIVGAADFTGDGVTDLLASTHDAVAVFEGNSNRTFRVPPPLPLPAPAWYGKAIAADLDGDGLDELIYGSTETAGFVVARPDGAGGFTIETLPAFPGALAAVSLGEIAIGTGHTGMVEIFTRGAGGWTSSRSLSLPPFEDLAFGDFNRDRKNEVAVIVASDAGRSLRVVNTQTQQLFLDIPLPANQAEYDVLAYDGKLFLTLGGTARLLPGDPPMSEIQPDGRVLQYTFLFNGSGIEQTVLSGKAFHSTVAGDFNGDGRTDVLSADVLALGLLEIPGYGDRRPVPGLSRDRIAGDLNGDGATDLVMLNGSRFTYRLGSQAGLQPARAEWMGVEAVLPVIARFRRARPASLVFGTRELVEVTMQCVPSRRRGARH